VHIKNQCELFVKLQKFNIKCITKLKLMLEIYEIDRKYEKFNEFWKID
jgi:hypothetical protein